MRILGTFRDLDDPDQFVWLRGFEDMAGRAPALRPSTRAPSGSAHSAAANATMVDVDNVLLLRPAEVGPASSHDPARRPPVGAPERDELLTAVTIPPGRPRCRAVPGENALARFVTEHGENDFPALRCGRTSTSSSGSGPGSPSFRPAPRRLRLQPTPRSLLPCR